MTVEKEHGIAFYSSRPNTNRALILQIKMSGQGLNRTNNMLLILVSSFYLFILRVHKFPWKVQVHRFRTGRTEYHFT